MKLTTLLPLVFLSHFVLPQENLTVQDLEKGVQDFNLLRAELMESGYVLYEKDNQSEFWKIVIEVERPAYFSRPSYTAKITTCSVQVSEWKDEEGEIWSWVVYFRINKKYLSDYDNIFFKEIQRHFPDKKSVEIQRKDREEDDYRTDYNLVYTRPGSRVEVEVDRRGESWMVYEFNLYNN